MKALIRFASVTYLIYVLVAVVVVMPALNYFAPRLALEYGHRELQSELIFYNPFTLAAVARGIELPDPDGHEFIAFKQAEVNLSLASLWQPGWVLDRMLLDDLIVHVRTLPEGELNFSDLLDSSKPVQPDTAPATLPGLTIADLQLGARRIAYTDLDREEPFQSELGGVSIAIADLSTIAEEGKPYSLSARGESDGELNWQGTLSIPGGRSEGLIQLSDIHLNPAWRFFEPMLAFHLEGARLDASARYHIDWAGDSLKYHIQEGAIALRELQTRDNAEDMSRLDFNALALDGISVDGPQRNLVVDHITLSGLSVSGKTQGEQISLVEMFTPDLDQAAPDTDAESETTAAEAEPWQVEIKRLKVPGATIGLSSPFTEPSRMEVNRLDLEISNLHWPSEQTAELSLELQLQDVTDIRLTGSVIPVTTSGTLQLAMTGLQVPWFSPNLPPQLKSSFTRGAIDLDASLTLLASVPLTLSSGGHLRDLVVDVEGVDQSLTQMRSLRWEDLAVDFNRQHARLERLLIDGYQGRLHIFADGTVNTQRAWQEVAEDAQASQGSVTAYGDGEEKVKDKAEAEATPAKSTGWTAELPVMQIADSSLDFMDESLPIHFQTVIGDLHGDITGISTDATRTAKIDLEGLVDKYAPVLLSGTVRPFDEPLALDLGLAFTGIDMATLTPYAGNYAGYQIDRGLLNLNLQYDLEQQQLKGDNAVIIKQLKLGKRVDSDDAADLPLNLAIALLSDGDGVIDLAVPVSGDVNDPEFDIGGIIGKAIVNAIVKIVTAPFTLLASLVGSDEDLERVAFLPGEASIGIAGIEKLQSLADALAQRPQLSLGITGRGGSRQDIQNLRQARFDSKLLARGLSEDQVRGRDSAWADLLIELYQENPPPPESTTEGGDSTAPTATQMHRYLRDQITVSDEELLALARARAAETKRYLVIDKGVEADRVFLEAPSTDEEFAGVTLRADS